MTYVERLRAIAKAIDGPSHCKEAAALLQIARELEYGAHAIADAAVPCDTFFEGLVEERPHILGNMTAQARIFARQILGAERVDAKRARVADMLGRFCPKAVA